MKFDAIVTAGEEGFRQFQFGIVRSQEQMSGLPDVNVIEHLLPYIEPSYFA